MHVSGSGRRALGIALPAALALTLAACGSGSNDSSNSNTDSTAPASASPAADSAAFGTPKKATGTPITIGVISDGQGAAIDESDEYKGAQAAAAYANDYLGGIAGHPITVKVCQARQDPAAATDCANQMVTAHASAVIEGTLAEIDQTVSVLSSAKIPLVAGAASTQAALSSPYVYSLFNGLSYFGVPAAEGKTLGATTADMVVIAVPGAEGPAKQVGTTLYKNAGIKLTVTAVPPGTADMTPQITTASANKPGLYHVFGNDSFCTSAIQAIKTVDPNTPIIALSQCLSHAGAQAIPGGYAGVKVVTTSDLDPTNPETKLFDAVIAKYGHGGGATIVGAQGYSPMLGMIEALNAASISDVSATGVAAGLKSAPATTYPLAAGAKFQCNGKQMPISPNVCSSNGILAEAKADGTLTNYRLIPSDPTLYSLPAAG
ncbi:ABC transporter substrate-binding protein [Nocardioides sp. BP30]|uniref:ABC transporter substrate-binding protein n=1 Tax=Nocardioides sp. BP30 TaxID=3036374 RepID=UPI0024694810|nr:ABC transporter substrate-binding protein [Nocardioides sp. BP30]WGL54092.1 ABC transporter substrate-binding protein [Nocardioides sp. BP30]